VGTEKAGRFRKCKEKNPLHPDTHTDKPTSEQGTDLVINEKVEILILRDRQHSTRKTAERVWQSRGIANVFSLHWDMNDKIAPKGGCSQDHG
jgi:hypothetical protein